MRQPFSLTYTIGLHELYNHPGLCILGLPPSQAHPILFHIVEDLIKRGRRLQPGERLAGQLSDPKA